MSERPSPAEAMRLQLARRAALVQAAREYAEVTIYGGGDVVAVKLVLSQGSTHSVRVHPGWDVIVPPEEKPEEAPPAPDRSRKQ